LWRDSYKRALKWSKNHAGDDYENQAVLEVNLECESEDMLNFTSTEWNNEQGVIKAYLGAIKALESSGHIFYFGHFLDSLIANDTDIKLVTMHDLTDEMHILNVKAPEDMEKETNFAFGDIQLCVKDASIIISKKEITV